MAGALALSSTLALGHAEAAPGEGEAGQCYLHAELTVERQLRRLSLDLRGHAPDYEEYAAVDGKSAVPEAQIDALMDSDAFRLQMRRFHESILWANPKGVYLQQANILRTSTGDRYLLCGRGCPHGWHHPLEEHFHG